MSPLEKIFFHQATADDIAAAWRTNPVDLVRALFYLRDKRNGLGRRTLFQRIFLYLLTQDPRLVQYLPLIPKYGNWKDLIIIGSETRNVEVRTAIATFYAQQLRRDLKAPYPSTAAKWYPSARSKYGRSPLTTAVQTELQVNEAQMRQRFLSPLRARLQLTETALSTGASLPARLPRAAQLRYKRVGQLRDPTFPTTLSPINNHPLELTKAILQGATSGIESQWPTTPTQTLTLIFDSRVVEIWYPIAFILAAGVNPYRYDTFEEISLPATTSLCWRVNRLQEVIIEEQALPPSAVPGDWTLIFSDQAPSPELVPRTGQQVIWWQSGLVVSRITPRPGLLHLQGFHPRIFDFLLNKKIPLLTEVVTTTLNQYDDVVALS